MRRRIAGVLAGALCVACWAAVPASAQTPAWSVVPSPNRGPNANGLAGVSCVSLVACMAVGGYAGSGGLGRTLAESWDGTRWSVLPSPNRARTNDGLLGVSCVSAVACMAVGGSGFPSGGAPRLSGGVGRTLTESWDGARWSVLPSPSPGSGTDLSGVSCVSADACMAVGAYGNSSGVARTLIESWDGTRWSVLPSPNPGTGGDGLDGVSCTSKDACMAVGGRFSNGTVSRTLVESWDGTRWSVLPSPSPGTANRLDGGVSCVATDACMAAGNEYESNGFHASLVESWDGSRWSVVPSPSPGLGFTEVYGMSCATEDACAIAGYYNSTGGAIRTLIEAWNGTRWSVVPTPSPGLIYHVLNGVSCATETTCTAVGEYYGTNGVYATYRTLVESGPVGIRAGKASSSQQGVMAVPTAAGRPSG